MLFSNDYTRMIWVSFLKEKSEVLYTFKSFKAFVENESDIRIKCLRSDRGGEHTSNDYNQFYEKYGIKRKVLVARTPQHNGVIERKNISIQETMRTMLLEVKLPDKFWKEAIAIAVYIMNIAPLRVNNNKKPYELWKDKLASVKYFIIFGRKCYMKINDDKLGNLNSRENKKNHQYKNVYLLCMLKTIKFSGSLIMCPLDT